MPAGGAVALVRRLPLARIAALAAAALALWVQLLRLRLRPLRHPGRLWFSLCTVAALTWSLCVARIAALVLPRALRERVCCIAVHFALRLALLLNPQIRLRGSPQWGRLPARAMLLMPHTSWLDTVLFSALLPGRLIQRARGLFKSKLLELPVGGTVFRLCGHFPVYYKRDDDGAWAVDQEKQKPVTEAVDGFLSGSREPAAGYLGYYPEGALNKNPGVLQPFRYGAFEWALRHQLPVWAFVMVGCEESWPTAGGAGAAGSPADIDVALVELVGDPQQLPEEQRSKAALAELCRERMQCAIDEILEKRVALGGPAGERARAALQQSRQRASRVPEP
eukprot:TRINITY_DN2476_c0_g1_i1.p1 TRINITY_DN2476_c0_g1~~TRINITY_DN2476_c0_g1_i1.p1  ORF type:complete len:336 (+),score=96.39 TRINITY_DN2476_c0_g1_i1:79-1086(+)